MLSEFTLTNSGISVSNSYDQLTLSFYLRRGLLLHPVVFGCKIYAANSRWVVGLA